MTTPANTLPYNRDRLIHDAFMHFDINRKDVVESSYSLYEKGFISYPLTHSEHLPTAISGQVAALLANNYCVSGNVARTDSFLSRDVWNDNLAAPHHAIIPLESLVGENKSIVLNETEKMLFGLVWRTFAGAFGIQGSAYEEAVRAAHAQAQLVKDRAHLRQWSEFIRRVADTGQGDEVQSMLHDLHSMSGRNTTNQ